uniref:Uncharacterized protein n=1 Tax=Panagrolaimus superbus TaxID=310955 RepID=A0A914XTD4_9BILA
MVRKAKLLAAEYAKLAILIEGNDIAFTPNTVKSIISFFMEIIDGANSVVSLSNEIDLDIIPVLDSVKNTLKTNIKQLHNSLTTLNEEIHNETAQIIFGDSLNGFNKDIIGTIDEILFAFDSYLFERNETNKQLLHDSCFRLTNNDTLSHIADFLQKSAVTNLYKENFSDAAFDALNSLYSKIIAEILLFYPQCYFIEKNSVLEHKDLDAIQIYVEKQIIANLAKIDVDRETAYFNKTIVSEILKKHLNSGKSMREIAANIGNEFEQNYQNINEKHSYKYSVIVYKDVQGYDDHAVEGNNYRHVFHYNNKNVIIFRGHIKNGSDCAALNEINYKYLSGCSKDLSVLSHAVIERCPNINNAVFITHGANPEIYPQNLESNQWMGYKFIPMKGCWFIKNRALFYSYN